MSFRPSLPYASKKEQQRWDQLAQLACSCPHGGPIRGAVNQLEHQRATTSRAASFAIHDQQLRRTESTAELAARHRDIGAQDRLAQTHCDHHPCCGVMCCLRRSQVAQSAYVHPTSHRRRLKHPAAAAPCLPGGWPARLGGGGRLVFHGRRSESAAVPFAWSWIGAAAAAANNGRSHLVPTLCGASCSAIPRHPCGFAGIGNRRD